MIPLVNTDTDEIARRIRLARRLTGMSQEDAARALGVAVRTYARWENAESLGFMERLEDIAAELETSPEALLGTSDDGSLDERLAAMEAELRELKALLMDPHRLKAAADALIDEERPKRKKT